MVEGFADLAAMALEQNEPAAETEGQRARDELGLKRAAAAVSASLDLNEVYTRGGARGGHHRRNTRSAHPPERRAGELRTAAQVDFSDELAARLVSLDSSSFERSPARGDRCCASAPTPRRSDA